MALPQGPRFTDERQEREASLVGQAAVAGMRRQYSLRRAVLAEQA